LYIFTDNCPKRKTDLLSRGIFGYLLLNFRPYFNHLMRVLGIDPGSETLGWGVVESVGSKYRLVDFGTVRSNPRIAFSKRILKAYEGVVEIVDGFHPSVLSIEEAFYAVNPAVAIKLGQVRGAILLLAEQKGLEIAEYSARLIKKTVVGYGNAEKRQVQEVVRLLLGLKAAPEPHDAADALAIAICHFHHAGLSAKLKAHKLKPS
jgi:crossover junction endodeoxyribonuclease RuvC